MSSWGIFVTAGPSRDPAGRAVAFGLQDALGRSRIFLEHRRRSHRSACEIAAAIGADAAQHAFGAGGAESALEGADHRIRRIGREILVAAFAVWAEFQHVRSLTLSVRAR